MRLGLLVLLAVLILPALLGPAAGGPEPPTDLATAYNTQRKIARSGDGTISVAVSVNVSGTPQVRVLSSTDGATWTTLPPPSATGLASDRSALAIDSRGRLRLVWTELQVDGGQVFYAAYATGAWSTPEQLSHSPGYAGFPSLAVDAQDRAHVVWYGFDGTNYQIYYRRLEPSGWTSERALTNENVDATNPAIALGPQGHVHVAWFRETRNLTNNEVAYLRVEGDVLAETRAVSEPGIDSVDPSLAVDAAGTAHLAWSALVAGRERIAYAARASNGTWSAVELASPDTIGARHPSLAVYRQGDVRLVWEGADEQIHAQALGPTGWSASAALTTSGVNRYPNARWAQFHNPVCPEDVALDVVWTEVVAGVPTLAYTGLTSSLACPEPASEVHWVWIVAAALLLGAFLYLMWKRTRGR
jgi:hypothetical protein